MRVDCFVFGALLVSCQSVVHCVLNTTSSPSLNATIGSSVSFTCHTSNRTSTIRWYKDNPSALIHNGDTLTKQFSSKYDVVVDRVNQQSTLNIHSVAFNDSGNFICSETGTAQYRIVFQLHVNSTPSSNANATFPAASEDSTVAFRYSSGPTTAQGDQLFLVSNAVSGNLPLYGVTIVVSVISLTLLALYIMRIGCRGVKPRQPDLIDLVTDVQSANDSGIRHIYSQVNRSARRSVTRRPDRNNTGDDTSNSSSPTQTTTVLPEMTEITPDDPYTLTASSTTGTRRKQSTVKQEHPINGTYADIDHRVGQPPEVPHRT